MVQFYWVTSSDMLCGILSFRVIRETKSGWKGLGKIVPVWFLAYTVVGREIYFSYNIIYTAFSRIFLTILVYKISDFKYVLESNCNVLWALLILIIKWVILVKSTNLIEWALSRYYSNTVTLIYSSCWWYYCSCYKISV